MKKYDIAIHQPNFFPWLGFFEKISKVKKFVFLDHITVSEGKGYWSRVKILNNSSKLNQWLTIPIKKKGYQKIAELMINTSEHNNRSIFKKKHLKNFLSNYSKFEFFDETYELIKEYYNDDSEFLSIRNQRFIERLSKKLKFDTEFVRTSNIENENLENLKSNQLILEIVKQKNAKSYLSGDGCKDFIIPESFEKHDIKFQFQNFNEYKYLSNNHGLSIIHALMKIGINELSKNFLNDK